jgi:BirA family biotin operon repressor/biotin-[acetyl-CoA-carboxylase] ligase
VLSEAGLRRALVSAGLDAPVRWDDVTTSTNDVARELAAGGAPAWSLVGAGHQTAGRGRAGRTWVDQPGGAVMLSLVLRPSLPPARLGLVSLATGVAMADAATELSGLGVRCTWPNDLQVDGAKVGGILAESEVEGEAVRYVVVGIGVNLAAPADVPGAGALGDLDAEALVAAFLHRLASLLDDTDEIVDAWRAVSGTLGRNVEATTHDGTVVRGVARDVDETGALWVDAGDRAPVRVAFGDVRHLVAEP